MDRLEEIKKEVTEIDSRLLFEFPDEYGILEGNILWLISEIEQLKKEKDFMIQCPKCGEKITREEMDDLMVYCSAEYNTQQALKE